MARPKGSTAKKTAAKSTGTKKTVAAKKVVSAVPASFKSAEVALAKLTKELDQLKKQSTSAGKKLDAAVARVSKSPTAAAKKALVKGRGDAKKISTQVKAARAKVGVAFGKLAEQKRIARTVAKAADQVARGKALEIKMADKVEADLAMALSAFETKRRKQRSRSDEKNKTLLVKKEEID